MDTTSTPVVARTAQQKLDVVCAITREYLTPGGIPGYEAMRQIAAVVETGTGGGQPAPALEQLLRSWDTLAVSTATSPWEKGYRQSRAAAAQELRAAINEARRTAA